ncbi:MAG TPA: pyridoxal-phosphate dependent enzyme, partial [Streptosporangiaceae bacterium]
MSGPPRLPLPWHATPLARAWTCPPPARSPAAFHALLPDYSPTPLIDVPSLAAGLGVGRVLVKDESSRLGLPAFKALGASWAVHQLLATGAGDGPPGPHDLAGLRRLAAARPGLVLVTATDGNHGRAVARMARLTGAAARVFVPAFVTGHAAGAIAAEGAEVVTVPGSYDEAVAAAARWVPSRPGAVLVQDTAWPGYEQVPGWIVEGYSTLFAELDEQLTRAGAGPPALVVVPVGVGSLAQAAVAHYRGHGRGAGTALLAVEPDTAACTL